MQRDARDDSAEDLAHAESLILAETQAIHHMNLRESEKMPGKGFGHHPGPNAHIKPMKTLPRSTRHQRLLNRPGTMF